MSSDNKGKIKIGLNAININKKIDFSAIKSNQQSDSKPQFSQEKPQQFHRPTFDFTKTDIDEQPAENRAEQRQIQQNQFKKIDFKFQQEDKQEKPKQAENKPQQQAMHNAGQQNRQQFRDFKSNFKFENTQKPQQNSDQNAGFVKKDGFNKFEKPKFGGNTGFAGVKKPFGNSNFVKKDNKVKVKLKEGAVKNDKNDTFKRTANTGSGVDKYSVNSMLKTFANNLELDTEIDDVLGNVINVKTATINSSHSFQHERKTRTASAEKKKPVNFNQQIVRDIEIYNDQITLDSLANQMAVSVKELERILNREGIEVEDDIIDGDTAQLIAENFGHNIKRIADNDAENEFIAGITDNRKDLRSRAPIVTIMGHVDHGKTTLLDYIRKASVASGEAGGITQHIGAYRTKVGDRWITFLDTPGHAAFTQMRARGAQATDIVVIVIAADDGIMPQTIEAINHAKVAGCPIIVAINKIDKPEANVENAKNMLLQHEVIPEELGGDVMVVPISAKEGRNVDKLLEAILVQADVLELKAYYDGGVDGVVVESKLDKKRGALSTIIVKNGTLSQGDFIIAGGQYGKIKGMFDENGKMLKTAEPSVPVEILGLNATPDAGEIFYAVKNEKDAKEVVEYRKEKAKQEAQNNKIGISKEDIFARMKGENGTKKVAFIIKADTKGSLEAIVGTLEKMDNEEVKPQIAHTGVGAVSESDVLLASTCGGFIFTFNTQKCDKKVLDLAEKSGVEIRDYRIIYELFDDVKDILSGKLKPVIKKNVLGHCEVKAIFEISKVGKIAGCLVKDGTISRGANVAVMRNGALVFETKCSSLKQEKESVKDVQSGKECGVGLENIDDVKQGDVLEFFTIKEEKKTL